jgi:aspartate racemase
MGIRVQYKGYELDFAAYPTAQQILASYEELRNAVSSRINRAKNISIPVISREGELPLSYIQESLWLQEQLHPGSAAYTLPAAVRLSGHLDVAALERSLSEVVKRHESLRTRFPMVDGEPRQVISKPQAWAFPIKDFSMMSPPEQETAIREHIESEVRKPFDLEKGPLLRSSLLKLGPQEHIAVLAVHHIVSDAWSMGILLRELARFYEAYSAGTESPLAELPVQYADYAKWQRDRFTADVLERTKEFWKQQLAGVPAFLDLPLDFPRPEKLSADGAHYFFHFPPELTQKLKELLKKENITMFALLLAAFQVLLAKFTSQQEIVVGTPMAGRISVELEGLIGCFINIPPLRMRVAEHMQFIELLRNVQNAARSISAHQEIPFEKIIEALGIPRHPAYTPVYQVLFDFVNTPPREARLSTLTMSPVSANTGATKMDLLMDMWESNGELTGHIEYRTALFKKETIATLARGYEVLVGHIAAAPHTRISQLDTRTQEEKQQILAAQATREELNRRRFAMVQPQAIEL